MEHSSKEHNFGESIKKHFKRTHSKINQLGKPIPSLGRDRFSDEKGGKGETWETSKVGSHYSQLIPNVSRIFQDRVTGILENPSYHPVTQIHPIWWRELQLMKLMLQLMLSVFMETLNFLSINKKHFWQKKKKVTCLNYTNMWTTVWCKIHTEMFTREITWGF